MQVVPYYMVYTRQPTMQVHFCPAIPAFYSLAFSTCYCPFHVLKELASRLDVVKVLELKIFDIVHKPAHAQ